MNAYIKPFHGKAYEDLHDSTYRLFVILVVNECIRDKGQDEKS